MKPLILINHQTRLQNETYSSTMITRITFIFVFSVATPFVGHGRTYTREHTWRN
ncbi:hypothetical protein C5167_032793 [Papaver somniferum]|uniref:Uncharacterized protein n=1 Tax=Papaver somniferum TaxID=3469 RepID=A0A4Y7KC91_PAPSO|nr:hypothetical protein C5167_032793 [Papaver somniferum]